MILRGILDNSLGGFTCIRGFAKMGDLVKISRAGGDFQRKKIIKQESQIIKFLTDAKYLFFPEVILSYTIDPHGKQKDIFNLSNIKDTPVFSSDKDNLRFYTRKTSYKSKTDIRFTENVFFTEIRIKDIFTDTKPFFRIDGNHRLSGGESDIKFYDYPTPFCLILFSKDQKPEQFEKVIFHNINSKTEPLTPEENLNVILNDELLWTDDFLRKNSSFGTEYVFGRHLSSKITAGAFPYLIQSFVDREHDYDSAIKTSSVSLCKYILQKRHAKDIDHPVDVDSIYKALVEVNNAYADYEPLRKNQCLGLLIASVYYFIKEKKISSLKAFLNWVQYNNLHEIDELEPNSFVEIYNKVAGVRHKTVFVSMPFGNKEIAKHYENIDKAIQEINKEFGQAIKIRKIRIDHFNEGFSYSITDKILELIEGSGYLIADITEPNSNVYHELGFLMGLDKAKGINNNNFTIISRIPKLQAGKKKKECIECNFGFNIRNLSQLRFTELDELRDKIKETLIIHYQLK